MNWQPVSYAIPLIVAAFISVAVALYCWQRRATAGARQFALLMLAVSVWSLSYALELSSVSLSTKLFWSKVEYLGIVTIPTTWLAFALRYTGREKWLTSRNRLLLAIQPIVTLLLAWTNEAHSLIWREVALDISGPFVMLDITHGGFFWLNVVYAYSLLLLGTFLVVQTLIRSTKLYRRQVAVLLVGLLAPWVGNALYISPINPFPNLDLTPFGYALSGLAVTWGLFRFRLLDIVPVARNAVVANMPDGVIVLDAENRIIDINPAAQRIIGRREEEAIGQPAVLVMAGRPDLVEHFRSMSQARGEIVLGGGESQGTYDLHTSPLLDRRGRLTGWLVMLHDVTERKRTEQALETQKQLFENLVTVARATSEHPTLQTTLKNVLNVASTLTGAELSSLCLLDETGAVTDAILARGEEEPAQQRIVMGQVLEDALAGWAIQHRQSVLVHDTARDNRQVISWDESYVARSALIVPIIRGQVVSGVLTLAHSATDHFNEEHQRLMEAAADQMALALHNAQIYEAQRRLANRQATLYEVLRTVGAYLDLETVVRVAVRVVARMTNWPAVAVLLPGDSGTDEASRLTSRATAGSLASTDVWDISSGQGIIGRAFRTKETQYVPDVSADPDYISADPAVCSEMAVPLRRGAHVLGVLNIESDQLAAFDANDVLLAESLAEAIALAMDNAQLHTEMTQHADDLAGLYTIAHIVSQSLVLEDTLSEALSSVLTSLDFDVGVVSLVHPADGHLYLAAEAGLEPAFRDQFQREGMDGTLCAYVHSNRRNILTIGDIEETSAVVQVRKEAPMVIDGMRALGMRSYVGIPLLYQEQSLGTLSLFACEPRAFSLKTLAQQMAIGQQIAAAVANARLFQSIADEHSRLQALIESSRDGIILIGMDLRVLVMNATALDFLDLAGQPEDWIGRPLRHALGELRRHAPAVVRATLAEMRRVQKGDEPVGEGEYEVSARNIHWLNLPVISDAMPLGRLLVLHDVTQERLLESMRDDLTRTMVHDLRNPLTSISVSLEILNHLLTDTISTSQREMLDVAYRNTKRMLGLVSSILDISRLEGGQMPLEKAPVSVTDLVAVVVESQLPLIAEKGLYLKNDVSSDLPAAYADGGLIERVLYNLVDNAIKFTPTGGAVHVAAKVDGAGESKLFISVSDTGPGISPEIRDRLFHKFVTGQQEERGSGLGLAFCRMVVEAHGEQIWVENASGEGTTFTFTLPLATGRS